MKVFSLFNLEVWENIFPNLNENETPCAIHLSKLYYRTIEL